MNDLSFVDRYKDIRKRLMPPPAAIVVLRERPRTKARRVYSKPCGPRLPVAANKENALTAIAIKHRVTEDAILGREGAAYIVAARHEFWHFCFRILGWTAAETGRVVGREHSTILYGVKKHEGRTPKKRNRK